MKKNYFPLIDILRLFAALSVVIYHIIEHYGWKSFPSSFPLVWFKFGWMGVDIFFVISGFVIPLTAFKYLNKYGSNGFKKDFISKRIKRIVPLYYATLFIFLVFISPQIMYQVDIFGVLTHLLFIHNFFVDYHGSINGVNWSLGPEMQFYLVILFFAPLLRKSNIYVIAAIALSITYCWRIVVFNNFNMPAELGVYKMFVYATQLPGMLDEFLIGLLIARFIMSDKWDKLEKSKVFLIIAIFSALILTSITLKLYIQYSTFWNNVYMVVFFRTLFAISVGSFIIVLCSINFGKVMTTILKPFCYGGTISYGIYLWHLPILLSVQGKLPWLSNFNAMLLIIVLTLLTSSLSWHFFEKKFLQNR